MDTTEDLVAASLSKHAADAPSDDHLLSTVHHRLRRRRTGRTIGAVVLACAAVATAVTATHSLTTELRTDPSVARPGAPDPGWRWESYKAVQIQVPSSWTQYISGPAPCTTFANSAVPTIGRLNGWLSKNWYTCSDAVLPLIRRQPYLWFDDVQAPGIKTYDGGWTEETRVIGGTRVSVLTNDDALRRRILDSGRPITGTDDYGCTPADFRPHGTRANDPVISGGICEYWKGSLVAGSSLPTARAAQLARLLTTAPEGRPPGSPPGCQDVSPRTYVVILHTRSTSWPVRVSYSTCNLTRQFPADDGTTARLVGYPALDLIRTGVHNPGQPSDLFDPARPVTPPPR
jgi:hypothetical protein